MGVVDTSLYFAEQGSRFLGYDRVSYSYTGGYVTGQMDNMRLWGRLERTFVSGSGEELN